MNAEPNILLANIQHASVISGLVRATHLGHIARVEFTVQPALGISLATATTDFVSASFIKYWARGTQCTSTMLDPRSNLLSLSRAQFGRPHRRVPVNPALVRSIVCGVESLAAPLCTTIARVRQNSKPVFGTLLRRRPSPTYS